jgi:trigger factor
MNITRENIDQLNAVVKVQIEKADYEQKVEDVLKAQRRKAQIKGFRPGNAPMGLIRKLYGKSVLFDELNKLVSENLSKYITEEKLDILGDPLPHETSIDDLEEQTDFTFSFDLGLSPQFEPSFTKKNKIPYYIITPDDKMREGYIDNYQRKFGEFVNNDIAGEKSMVKGTLVQLGDNLDPLEEGIVVEDASILLTVVGDEEEKNLFVGKKVGDKVIFNLRKALKNETEIASLLRMKKEEIHHVDGSFSLELTEIRTFMPAELNEELFSRIYPDETGMTADDFRKKIDEELAMNLSKESDHRFRIDAISHAVEKTEFDLPEEFLKRWLLNVNENLTSEQLEQEFDGFKKDMKWQLLRNRIARDNEVKVTEEDLLGEAMAVTRAQFMQYGLYYITDEQLAGYASEMIKKEEDARKLADRVLDSKVVDWIKENVKVEEKKVSSDDFNKLFE